MGVVNPFYLNDPSRFLWIMFKLTLHASRCIQLNFSFVSATKIFVLCDRLKPETKQAKKERLRAMAEAKAEGKTKDPEPKKDGIVYGIKEVVSLVESKRAALVVIAHDVDPIEVIFGTYLNWHQLNLIGLQENEIRIVLKVVPGVMKSDSFQCRI